MAYHKIFTKEGGKNMDIVLATLIVKKMRFYKDLEPDMKERVKPLLIALERADLIVEE